jgi:general secretion pathway protein G
MHFPLNSILCFFEKIINFFHENIYPFQYWLKIIFSDCKESKEVFEGFTLLELMVVIAFIGILSGIGIPAYTSYIEKAKILRTMSEIKLLEKEIMEFQEENGFFPDSLDEIGRADLKDPWGNNYQYLNIETTQGQGQMRKDRFLVPLNTDFDLYSMGKDGKSQSPLTAQASHDDIIRANDGEYMGIASEY